jgi:sugar phosphate isomerase/epimerase
MPFIDRIGIDVGRRLGIEAAIAWAAQHDVRAIDVQCDIQPNALESFDERRCQGVREAARTAGVRLALHTLSAVNIAEVSPFLREAADQYLAAYVSLAARLEAKWVIVHGGYHFTSDKTLRKEAAIARLARAAALAEEMGVRLLLENLNGEPERAEVHYVPDTLEDTREVLARVPSPALKWSFTINHAHYDPIGIAGFVRGMGMDRCGEVRVADNNGLYELHMHPGTGTVDFVEMFRLIEGMGYRGPYTCGWGTLEEMLEGRAWLAEKAREAGVAGRSG